MKDEAVYFNALNSGNGWVRFKTQVQMFFSGYELREIKNKRIEPEEPEKEEPVTSYVLLKKQEEETASGTSSFEHFPNREEACIPKNTIIEGSISTKSSLVISGFVRGEVVSENNVTISGKVEGNIQAKSLHITKGTVYGNLNCVGDIQVGELSIVKGNIESQTLDCAGEIRGDIKTIKSVVLKSGAFVDGNISTKSINTQEGSVLCGNVEMPKNRVHD